MFTIRRANLDDLETLTRLRIALLRELGNIKSDADAATVTEANRRYFSRKIPGGEYVAWVAEAEGQIVATGGVVFFERPPKAGNLSGLEAYVIGMYTVPDWRGKGAATALMQAIVAFLQKTDARRVWLHATEDGRQIYEKIGFVASATEMDLGL